MRIWGRDRQLLDENNFNRIESHLTKSVFNFGQNFFFILIFVCSSVHIFVWRHLLFTFDYAYLYVKCFFFHRYFCRTIDLVWRRWKKKMSRASLYKCVFVCFLFFFSSLFNKFKICLSLKEEKNEEQTVGCIGTDNGNNDDVMTRYRIVNIILSLYYFSHFSMYVFKPITFDLLLYHRYSRRAHARTHTCSKLKIHSYGDTKWNKSESQYS